MLHINGIIQVLRYMKDIFTLLFLYFSHGKTLLTFKWLICGPPAPSVDQLAFQFFLYFETETFLEDLN